MTAVRIPSPRLLVLWDVDHTLIDTRGVGRAIYDRAFRAATGKPLEHLANFSGRTELDIMRESLRLNNREPTDDMVAKLAAALVQGYQAARDELRTVGRALPGAASVLAALAQEPALYQTVLTGNLRDVAHIKLHTFGLARYLNLEAGAYGDDQSERAALVPIAQERASERSGIHFDADTTTLVGDTPQDIEAGRRAGVHVIGVATGKTDAPTLQAAGATAVAQDLDECRRLILGLIELLER